MDFEILAKLLSPAVAALALYIAITKRPKLVSYMVHATGIPYEGMNVHTHSIVVRNNGREPATNVRLIHRDLPHFSIFPPCTYTIERYEGGADIVLPRLVPKDQITVSYLYQSPLTFDRVNMNLKSDEGLAKIINVVPAPVVSAPVRWMLLLLVLIGASVVLYPIVLLVGYWLGLQ